ncbi:PspC domain-containing protein [Luteipulveratus halotolerans]|uniref:PspC domain-containing protein n=1 Tax=Luteipulveratus halotolerans TaxID=1631356 RepID=UPI0018D19824|nr:PspC domain-containing protein [Luteipulveratus halotolerans]
MTDQTPPPPPQQGPPTGSTSYDGQGAAPGQSHGQPHGQAHGGASYDGRTGTWSHGTGGSGHDISFDRFLGALRDRGLPHRSDEKWIGGVCAGIAERLRVDPLIVRAGFILLGLVLGAGVTLYLIAWLLLPDRRGTILLERAVRHSDGGAITLMVVTVLVVSSGFGWMWGWGSGWGPGPLIPLLVIGLCVWAYLSSRTGQPGVAPTSDSPYSSGGSMPTPDMTQAPAAPAYASAAAPTTQPRYASTAPPSSWTSGDGRTPPPAPVPRTRIEPQPPRPRRRPLGAALSWALLGLAAAVGGVTSVVLQQTAQDDVAGRVGIAAALGAIGAGLLAAGFAGRKAAGVAFVGWLLALVTAVLVILPKDLTLNGEYGDATWTPSAATTQKYELATGDGRLDLTGVAAPTSQVVVPAKVSFGQLTVVVPAGVPVEIRTHVGLGALEVEDGIEHEIGWKSDTGGKDVDRTIRLGAQPATLVVDANVGIGAISIERKPAR